ncbi:hypothetical protein DFH06DRAFT_977809 [Mycena polygramma]|nr:hypothetical protein DFH06DRAFT_977809 [Mycena polygramma]
MPLLKILCILVTTVGLHMSSTSPNPPLGSAQLKTIAPTRVEFILNAPFFREVQKASVSSTFSLNCVQIFYWWAAIAETIILVARFGPPSILSELLISALVLGGEPPVVHITPSLAFGCTLVVSGALLRLRCYRVLGKHFTFETGILHKHELITTGPYQYIRHPGYSGAILVHVGLLLYYGSPGSWFIECLFKGTAAGSLVCASYIFAMTLVVFGLVSRIPKEDEGLQREFGTEWAAWAARVPYVLIPGIY